MKNKREIYQALLDGKKLKHPDHLSNNYLFINESGELVNADNVVVNVDFTAYELWYIYTEAAHYNFSQALNYILEGKRLKRKKWDEKDCQYVYVDYWNSKITMHAKMICAEGYFYTFTKDDLLAKDWLIIGDNRKRS
jgi:hypothetical protein